MRSYKRICIQNPWQNTNVDIACEDREDVQIKKASGGSRVGRSTREQPTVYVIAGPNGAGKTTFASEFLPDFVQCREFLNADLIAAGLSPFAPEAQNVRAGRLLLERIRELAREHADFGFETTLSGRSYGKLLSDLRASGYRVLLFFLWLPTAGMAIARVANRVKQGGHSIPPDDIKRRHAAGVRNLFRLYRPLLDGWWLYDASRLPPKLIAVEEHGQLSVKQKRLFRQIEQHAEGDHEE
jgi:predicted ABC-type ATPase